MIYIFSPYCEVLKEADHFKYLGSVLTRDGYWTREIKMRTATSGKTHRAHPGLYPRTLGFKATIEAYLEPLASRKVLQIKIIQNTTSLSLSLSLSLSPYYRKRNLNLK